MKDQPPQRAEDDDRRHVESPTGELIVAHARFAHRIEEELEVPGRTGEGGEEEIAQVVDFDGLTRLIGILDCRRAELIEGFVLEHEKQAPDEVGRETAKEDYAQLGEADPESASSVRGGDFCDRFHRLDAERHASAKEAGDERDKNTLGEVELFDRGLLLFRGHFAFFRHSRETSDDNAQKADAKP